MTNRLAPPRLAGLRFRQVHLDFHTSPLIPHVGAEFDADLFGRTLSDAHIDSITCFATCHHGLSYYPTTVGTMHPTLRHDLLGEQIAAAHRYGINVPAYITVVWNEHMATMHPEWRQVHRDGRLAGRMPVGPQPRGQWQWMCLNTPYADHIAAVTEEVIRLYPIDGLFLDIVMTISPGCACPACLHGMAAAGLDPENDADLRRYSLSVERDFIERISQIAWRMRPDLPLFFNSRLRLAGTPELGCRPEAPFYTHWEIESLPSGGWGYMHFPLYNRFFQTLDKPRMGMTAAFHRSWADFGTVKNQAALDYECARALAGGAVCSVGDQMHPNGILNPETYRRIGAAYAHIEACEPWCQQANPLAEVAILLRPQVATGTRPLGLESEEGAARMLLETGAQFAVIDREADFSAYTVIIAPDDVHLDEGLAARLRAYLAAGGALLCSHESGLTPSRETFALNDLMGVTYHGPARDDVEFLRPTAALGEAIPSMDHALYERGSAVQAWPQTSVLAEVISPYFSRTWAHFHSHAQTPPNHAAPIDRAAITVYGRVSYVSHPIFRSYRDHGYPIYRQIVQALLARFLPQPLIQSDLPTTAEVTLLHQPASAEGDRLVCHVLHYVPQRRAPDLDLVEDVIPLHNRHLMVRTEWTPARVYLAPARIPLATTTEGSYTHVALPQIDGHAMVIFEQ